MRKKINQELYKHFKNQALQLNSLELHTIYSYTYNIIEDLLKDINKPFKNICIHGIYPQFILPYFHQKFNDCKITCASCSSSYCDKFEYQNNKNITIIDLEDSDSWCTEQQTFDLIISCLQLHHCNSQEKILNKYLHTLKSDGALIGCAVSQGTLLQLRLAYLLAQNQRSGGISPKISIFPSLGQMGNYLTTTNYHITTVIGHQLQLKMESVIDVLQWLQLIGQNGYVKGRRKSIYQDVLFAMCALYQSQYRNNIQQGINVPVSIQLMKFIGWKFSTNQKKALRRGQITSTINFIDQIKKWDSELQHYQLDEQNQQPKQIK